MKIASILPYKENYTKKGAGAVALWISEFMRDSIFCATGITSGELVSGIKIENNRVITDSLITHKSTGLRNNVLTNIEINAT